MCCIRCVLRPWRNVHKTHILGYESCLGRPPLLPQAHEQGAGLEVEQPRLEPVFYVMLGHDVGQLRASL